MGRFTPGGASQGSGQAKSITIDNIVVPTANTEQSHELPVATTRFTLYSREAGQIDLAFSSGASATIRVVPGTREEIRGLSPTVTWTVYFSSTKAGDTIEITSYQ